MWVVWRAWGSGMGLQAGRGRCTTCLFDSRWSGPQCNRMRRPRCRLVALRGARPDYRALQGAGVRACTAAVEQRRADTWCA